MPINDGTPGQDFSNVMPLAAKDVARDLASTWTPRDALLWLLNQIDSGKQSPNRLVMIVCTVNEDGSTGTQVSTAGTSNAYERQGILADALHFVSGP